jgi:predicted nucleotidyltransferase
MGSTAALATAGADSLSSALFGKTRRSVLALFYAHPDRGFYLREVSRLVKGGQGAVQRELQRLTDAQIVSRAMRGGRAFYQANRECPIFSELHNLILKTAGVVEVLRVALAPLASRMRVAFVYGSIARGAPKTASDVDLVVIGDVSFGDVVEALAVAQAQLARDVNPTVYDADEFRKRLARKDHFLTAVRNEPKLFVIGSDHECEQLARQRLARRS